MSNEVTLKQLFQGLIPEQVSVITAKVTSVNPLGVVSINNQKLQISAHSLIVPKRLKRYTQKMSFTIEDKEHNNVNVTVDNSLCVGDTVYLLWLENKSKFYVMDRS